MEEGRIHYLPLPVPSITTTIVFLLRELVHPLVVHEVPLGNAQVVQRVRVLEVVWAELALPVAAGALSRKANTLGMEATGNVMKRHFFHDLRIHDLRAHDLGIMDPNIMKGPG